MPPVGLLPALGEFSALFARPPVLLVRFGPRRCFGVGWRELTAPGLDVNQPTPSVDLYYSKVTPSPFFLYSILSSRRILQATFSTTKTLN